MLVCGVPVSLARKIAAAKKEAAKKEAAESKGGQKNPCLSQAGISSNKRTIKITDIKRFLQ